MKRRLKLVFLSWIGAYGLITLVFIVGEPLLALLPLLLRTMVLSLVMVVALNFLIVPTLTSWFRRWLDS
jgi:uncharacterized protein